MDIEEVEQELRRLQPLQRLYREGVFGGDGYIDREMLQQYNEVTRQMRNLSYTSCC